VSEEKRPFQNNLIFTEEAVAAAKIRLREKLALLPIEQAAKFEVEVHEDEDEDDQSIDDMFPFRLAEQDLIEKTITAIRERMSHAQPATLKKIAAFLYGLERLPYCTPGLALDLAIMDRFGGELSYTSVELDSQSFRLSSGGFSNSSEFGGDSFSETVFEIETGGFREGSTEAFSEWLDSFIGASGVIEVQGDDDVDLTDPSDEDGWIRLGKYWDYHGEDADGYY
jgi:hypothetical protein